MIISLINKKNSSILCHNIKIRITKRAMLRTIISKTSTIIGENSNTMMRTASQASYIVAEQESTQDTSKVNHPVVIKTSCESQKCNETNCTKDTTNCNIETQTSAIVGHKTHNDKTISDKSTSIQLDNDQDARGSIKTIIYSEKELIDHKARYDGYKHYDTVVVEQEENTAKLNELTKDMKIMQNKDE